MATRHIKPDNYDYEVDGPISGSESLIIHNQTNVPFGPIVIDGARISGGRYIGIEFRSRPDRWAGFMDVTISDTHVQNIEDHDRDCHGILMSGEMQGACRLDEVTIDNISGYDNTYSSLLYVRPECGYVYIKNSRFRQGRGCKIRSGAKLDGVDISSSWIGLDTYGKDADELGSSIELINNTITSERACIRAKFSEDTYSGYGNGFTCTDGDTYWPVHGSTPPEGLEDDEPVPVPPPSDLEARVTALEKHAVEQQAYIKAVEKSVFLHANILSHHNLTGGE